jgi:hypothetical protein
MTNPRYLDLLDRAKQAHLTAEEVEAVAQELRHPAPESDPYYLLAILGEAGAKQHRDLVERFLSEGNDPWLTRRALEVLCLEWGDTERYIDWIERFMAGVPWDAHDDIALLAVSCAGSYLRDHTEGRLFWNLLRIHGDHAERHLLREAAFSALATAVGRPPGTALGAEGEPSVLSEARNRFATRGG